MDLNHIENYQIIKFVIVGVFPWCSTRVRTRDVWKAIESLVEQIKWLDTRISQIDRRLSEHIIKFDEHLKLSKERNRLFEIWIDLSHEKWKEERKENDLSLQR